MAAQAVERRQHLILSRYSRKGFGSPGLRTEGKKMAKGRAGPVKKQPLPGNRRG